MSDRAARNEVAAFRQPDVHLRSMTLVRPSPAPAPLRKKSPQIPSKISKSLRTLLLRMLDKDSSTRVTAAELWDDPWVTDEGAQPLIPYEDNCIEFAEPTQADLDRALNSLRASTFIAMSVVAKLKGMVSCDTSGRASGSERSVASSRFRRVA